MKGIRRDGNFGEYIREEGEYGNEDVLHGKEEKLYVLKVDVITEILL